MIRKKGTTPANSGDERHEARPGAEVADDVRDAARDGACSSGEPVADQAPADPRDAEIERLRGREEDLLRALAELSNVQRRRRQEMEQSIRYARESLIRDLLPVLDDFERAMAAIPGAEDDPLRSGVALVRDRLQKTLEREGLSAIRSKGEPFDPTLHDAILTQPAPEGVAPGTVLDVAQAGYRLGDRVLRHAKVVVAGAAKEETS
jgi:molecular chaperone GrpE